MKTKYLFLTLFFFGLFSALNSQIFQRSYGRAGSETGTCVQSTLDGNYITSAFTTTQGSGYEDVYLLKTDTAGKLLWSKTYGGSLSDKAYFVSTCTDSGFIITGATSSFGAGNYDLYLIRTDSLGNLLWSTAIGGSGDDYGWNVIQTNDGGFLAAGYTHSFGNGSWDGYLVKTNAAGVLQWTKVFGGNGDDDFYGLAKTSDGGYILTGSSATHSVGSSDTWLVKLDANADTVWTRLYGKITEDAGNAVIQTADGGYMVAGDIHTTLTTGGHNASLLKTDSQGDLQWVRVYGSNPGSEIGYAVRQAPDGGYFLLGNTGAYGSGSQDILLVKASSVGALLWAKTYGSLYIEDAWYFHPLKNNGNVIVGTMQTVAAGQFDVFLVSTDSLGNSSCDQTAPAPLVNTPALQESRGTTITSGGVAVTPSTITQIPATITGDPCAFVGIVENTSLDDEVSIYPNPSNGRFTVSGLKSPVQIQVYSLFGEKVFETTVNSKSQTLNLNVARGIYSVKINSGEKIIVKKLVVE